MLDMRQLLHLLPCVVSSCLFRLAFSYVTSVVSTQATYGGLRTHGVAVRYVVGHFTIQITIRNEINIWLTTHPTCQRRVAARYLDKKLLVLGGLVLVIVLSCIHRGPGLFVPVRVPVGSRSSAFSSWFCIGPVPILVAGSRPRVGPRPHPCRLSRPGGSSGGWLFSSSFPWALLSGQLFASSSRPRPGWSSLALVLTWVLAWSSFWGPRVGIGSCLHPRSRGGGGGVLAM